METISESCSSMANTAMKLMTTNVGLDLGKSHEDGARKFTVCGPCTQ